MEDLLKELTERINHNEIAFFVGAGISNAKPSSLPSFIELQNDIIFSLCEGLENSLKNTYKQIHDEIQVGDTKSDLAMRFMNIAPEYVFEVCRKNILTESEAEEFYELQPLARFRHAIPNQNHMCLAQLLIKRHIPAVFTTNFDILIEDAISIVKRAANIKCIINKYWTTQQFSSIPLEEGGLFKIHGCINDLSSIIISLDDVAKKAIQGGYRQLKHFLENYYVFFTGFKGADLDIFNQLATINCKGIYWNIRSRQRMIPKISNVIRLKGGKIIEGDLDKIFTKISNSLGFPIIDSDDLKRERGKKSVATFDDWACAIDIYSKLSIMANLWEYVGEWQTAIRFYANGYRRSVLSSDIAIQNHFLSRLAGTFYSHKKFDNTRACCTLIIKNSEKIPAPSKLYNYITSLQLLSLIDSQENTNRAASLLNQALEYQNQLENIDNKTRHLRSGILLNIGNLLYRIGKSGEALEYYAKSLKIFDEFGDVLGRARILADLGNIYLQNGMNDECLRSYFDSAYIFSETGDILELAKIQLNIAEACNEFGMVEQTRIFATKAADNFYVLSRSDLYKKAIKILESVRD